MKNNQFRTKFYYMFSNVFLIIRMQFKQHNFWRVCILYSLFVKFFELTISFFSILMKNLFTYMIRKWNDIFEKFVFSIVNKFVSINAYKRICFFVNHTFWCEYHMYTCYFHWFWFQRYRRFAFVAIFYQFQ